MNAKSERASLPDRVEAAAKARHEAQFPNTPWRVMSEPTKTHDRELMAAALAAADACEAERNPNTTDEYEQVGYAHRLRDGGWRLHTLLDQCLHDPDLLVPVYARRAVSSEDVHRADFLAESVRSGDPQSPNKYGTEQK